VTTPRATQASQERVTSRRPHEPFDSHHPVIAGLSCHASIFRCWLNDVRPKAQAECRLSFATTCGTWSSKSGHDQPGQRSLRSCMPYVPGTAIYRFRRRLVSACPVFDDVSSVDVAESASSSASPRDSCWIPAHSFFPRRALTFPHFPLHTRDCPIQDSNDSRTTATAPPSCSNRAARRLCAFRHRCAKNVNWFREIEWGGFRTNRHRKTPTNDNIRRRTCCCAFAKHTQMDPILIDWYAKACVAHEIRRRRNVPLASAPDGLEPLCN
jgi:hypothetical protein